MSDLSVVQLSGQVPGGEELVLPQLQTSDLPSDMAEHPVLLQVVTRYRFLAFLVKKMLRNLLICWKQI